MATGLAAADSDMNPTIGWALAALAIAAGYLSWGWPGVALGLTVVAFWLVLQFNRALRVMRAASQRPVGSVKSAVMLNSQLAPGMTMMQVLPLTKSLGQRLGQRPDRAAGDPAEPEQWAWHDSGGDRVHTEWLKGKLHRWELLRGTAPAETSLPATAVLNPADVRPAPPPA